MATLPSDLLHTLPVFLHTQTSSQTKDRLSPPHLCDKSGATFMSVPARTRHNASSAALFCIFIRVTLRKDPPLTYLMKGKAWWEECWGGGGYIRAFDLCVKGAKVRFPDTMLSACEHAQGAEPRPLIAVHVDFDVALPSEHGGMSGSKPATFRRCKGLKCCKCCSGLELHQDHQTQEASKKFYQKAKV